MAGNDASTRARVERTGLGLVEVDAGLAALEGLLLQAAVPAQAAAVPIRWPKFLQQQFRGAPPPMFGAFAALAAAAEPKAAGKATSLARKASSRKPGAARRSTRREAASAAAVQSPADREAFMLQQVKDAVASVLGSADVDPQQPLMAAGLDSLSSVELRNSLEAKLGVELPTTLVFDYPSIAALAGFLATKVQPGSAGALPVDEGTADDSDGSEAAQATLRQSRSRRLRSTRRRRHAGAAETKAAGPISTEDHQAFMLQQVKDAVAAVLGSADVDPQQPLMAAGLDSLSSVELRNSLEAKLGVELPTTLVFDYPSIAALAGFLATKVQPGAGAAEEAGSSDGVTASSAESEASVVVRRVTRSRRSQRKRGSGSVAKAADVSAEDHQAFMLQQVKDAVAAVLGSADVDPQQPLMAAGLDSLSSVELRNSLEAKLGVELPTTLVFDYPSIAALAGFLATKVQPGSVGSPPSEGSQSDAASYASEASYSMDEEEAVHALVRSQREPTRDVVAVTGMVVRAPADAFAGIQGLDAVQMVPASRWDLEAHSGEHTRQLHTLGLEVLAPFAPFCNRGPVTSTLRLGPLPVACVLADVFSGLPVRFGSFLAEADLFDAAAFATSDAEAVWMDPQQRLLLEAVRELMLAQAGSTGIEQAARRDVGVFVGLSTVDYLKVGGGG
jgi:acyl carrier protein